MDAYNHTQAIDNIRRTIAGIVNDGHHPLRDYRRAIRARHTGPCGPYYFVPGKLITDASNAPEGFGGYLNSRADALDEGSFVRLRVKRADEIIRLRHTGWYTDDECIGETMFGVVATLPHSRGFLAGWSLGAQMATSFTRNIYETAEEAAFAADAEAQRAAERERDYRREHRDNDSDEE
jgi:hypothetical protein